MEPKVVKVKNDFQTNSSAEITCSTFGELKRMGLAKLGIKKENLSCIKRDNRVLSNDKDLENLGTEDEVIFEITSDAKVIELAKLFEKLEADEEAARTALIEKGKPMDSGFVRDALLMAADAMKGNAAADTVKEDKDWFKGIKGKPPKSKSAFLGKSAEARVRNYWAKAKGVINKVYNDAGGHDSDEEVEGPASKAANLKMDWVTKLRRAKFCKQYFGKENDSHSAAPSNSDGWFYCKGHYAEEKCQYGHRINPYSSYEQRKLFSTWEFDHIIEIRVIIPRLKEMLEDDEEYDDDSWDYLYECLFEAPNLRLVHPVCHDTHQHKGKVLDEDRLEPL